MCWAPILVTPMFGYSVQDALRAQKCRWILDRETVQYGTNVLVHMEHATCLVYASPRARGHVATASCRLQQPTRTD